MKSSRNKRPNIKVPLSQKDIQIEIFALVGVLTCIYMAAHYFPLLPGTIPTHFGASGRPDAWGPKITLWFMPALNVVLYSLLTIAARFPHVSNYPVKVKEENAQRLYRLGVSLLQWTKLWIVWMFTLIERGIVDVAMGKSNSLNPVILFAMLAVMLGTVAYFTVAMYRAR